jgi:hypothetical protein
LLKLFVFAKDISSFSIDVSPPIPSLITILSTSKLSRLTSSGVTFINSLQKLLSNDGVADTCSETSGLIISIMFREFLAAAV